jgi:ABC-type arginine transport system permease subunit
LLIGMVIWRRVEFHPFLSAVLVLGFVYSGYFAETFRVGMQPIPQGNLDAGRAFGMSERLILWRIALPQVVRRMLSEAPQSLCLDVQFDDDRFTDTSALKV